ncbi:MAG: hypothetical protein CL596_00190 [Alteromonas sp.]|nr:hypothetical protein [Alteromonas sp.]
MKSLMAFLLLCVLSTGYGQSSAAGSSEIKTLKTYQLNDNTSHFIIKGTSSLHDWEMVSNQFTGKISFQSNTEALSIDNIKVKVGVTTLESGKRVMDKKCYDALKSDTHPNILYEFKNIKSLKSSGPQTYTATLEGSLTIAGQTKSVAINVHIKATNNSITIKGEKPLKMTDFGVEPPTALLGTLKTGDDIIIDFNLNYL